MNKQDTKNEILPPDPSWEYFTIYGQLQTIRSEFDAILLHVGSIENPEKSNDIEIKFKLIELVAKIRSIAHNL